MRQWLGETGHQSPGKGRTEAASICGCLREHWQILMWTFRLSGTGIILGTIGFYLKHCQQKELLRWQSFHGLLTRNQTLNLSGS